MSDEVHHRLQAYTIKRKVYKCNHYSLDLYLPPVETLYTPGYYQVNPGAILYLNLPWKSGDTKNSMKSFSIRQSNRCRVARVFAEALNWFIQYKDLYVTDPNGKLFFNTEYNNLRAVYSPKYLESPQAIKIVPIQMEIGNGLYGEGVRVYINKLENFMELTRDELRDLYDMIDRFDFPGEIQICYQALLLSFNTGNLTDGTKKQNSFLGGK